MIKSGAPLIRSGLIILYSFMFLVAGYIIIRFLYPFVIGFILALLLLPFVNKVERGFGWSRSLSVILAMAGLMLILITFTTVAAVEIANGLIYLSGVLPDYIKNTASTVEQWITTSLLPVYDRINHLVLSLDTSQQETVLSSIQSITADVTQRASEFIQLVFNGLADLLLSLPNTITILLFSLLSAFFIAKDWPLILSWYERLVPLHGVTYVKKITDEWRKAISGYVLAQVILVGMTGVIVLIALLILGVKHAITTAVLIALVDVLPYLGTGIVFIPWILYSFFSGDWFMSIGLSVIYGIVVIQRQIAEPKVLSRHIGVHPLPLLITLFLSYQLLGFAGLLLGPMILIVLQSLVKAGVVQGVVSYIMNGK
ncbi:sporulation integral membrane protein YtvI [Bacillus sp. H-16]|uniref:sporulation integral membrane protein YtvI n=1 Tax=Alteribacter salitolerans TaxID=2912333 RepID=UPI00196622B7|nr:sporulation integral membrane protein YtvI [Alteribacter salitolerans]MBM7096467.1 sporulation integral membrane protein YtvI [Alteribacter salitolerans]